MQSEMQRVDGFAPSRRTKLAELLRRLIEAEGIDTPVSIENEFSGFYSFSLDGRF
jgi:hypothetical protein